MTPKERARELFDDIGIGLDDKAGLYPDHESIDLDLIEKTIQAAIDEAFGPDALAMVTAWKSARDMHGQRFGQFLINAAVNGELPLKMKQHGGGELFWAPDDHIAAACESYASSIARRISRD